MITEIPLAQLRRKLLHHLVSGPRNGRGRVHVPHPQNQISFLQETA